MDEYTKGFRKGYIVMILLSLFEGIVFVISGVCLAMLHQWPAMIVGSLLIVFGAASLMSVFQAAANKEWARAVYDGQAFNKPVSEMFENMEETTQDNPASKEEEDE